MKWLDDLAQDVAYPLRATWFDKFYVVAMPLCVIALLLFVLAALIRHL